MRIKTLKRVPKEKRTTISVTVSKTEHDAFKAACDETGYSMAMTVRNFVVSYGKKNGKKNDESN
jgi:hypothetical protein